MTCASVRDDNPRVSESRLSLYRRTDHTLTSLLLMCVTRLLDVLLFHEKTIFLALNDDSAAHFPA